MTGPLTAHTPPAPARHPAQPVGSLPRTAPAASAVAWAGPGRCAGALPGYCGAVAAALAGARPDPPWWLYDRLPLPPRARAHPIVGGGTPGWQITLLAAAALLAAAIAVTVYRRRDRRRTAATASPPRRRPGGKHLSQGAVNGKRADVP